MAKLQRFEGALVDLLEDPEQRGEFSADLGEPLLPTARAYLQNWIHGIRLGGKLQQMIGAVRGEVFHPEYSGLLARCEYTPQHGSFFTFGDSPEDSIEAQTPRLHQRIADWQRAALPSIPMADPMARNLELLAASLTLETTEVELIRFAYTLQSVRALQSVSSFAFEHTTGSQCHRLLAIATGRPEREVARALRGSGLLVSTGILKFDTSSGVHQGLYDRLGVMDEIFDRIAQQDLDRKALIEAFFRERSDHRLDLGDFPEKARELELALALLERALATGQRGINLLFHGPVGTGKTELAAALADRLRVPLYVVGEADGFGNSPGPRERLNALALSQRLIRPGGRALLLFDEVDDVSDQLPGHGSRNRSAKDGLSKNWLNALLERTPVPTLWITNRPQELDDAFVRRFSLVLRFENPGIAARRRLWTQTLAGDHDGIVEAIEALAQSHPVPPALIEQSARMARLASPEGIARSEAIERILEPTTRLLIGRRPRRYRSAGREHYSLDYLNASMDLDLLVDRLRGWRPDASLPGVTLCFHGLPGTGKTAFAHHLAERLGLDVAAHRASDLDSPYVGEMEQNLARAFEEAEESGALLLFDEADSFLNDRRHALRSWEVSQVNEFLQQLESHPGIVVCTTNRLSGLDAASLRRFVFKLEFAPLRPAQVRAFFLQCCAAQPADDERVLQRAAERAAALPGLTLGDFAAVQRRFSALRSAASAADWLEALRSEVDLRTPAGAPSATYL